MSSFNIILRLVYYIIIGGVTYLLNAHFCQFLINQSENFKKPSFNCKELSYISFKVPSTCYVGEIEKP